MIIINHLNYLVLQEALWQNVDVVHNTKPTVNVKQLASVIAEVTAHVLIAEILNMEKNTDKISSSFS